MAAKDIKNIRLKSPLLENQDKIILFMKKEKENWRMNAVR
jgi:hypothetical protein